MTEFFAGDLVECKPYFSNKEYTGIVVVAKVDWSGEEVIGVDIGQDIVEENDDFDPDWDDDGPEFYQVTCDLDGHLSKPTGYWFPVKYLKLAPSPFIEGDDDEDTV